MPQAAPGEFPPSIGRYQILARLPSDPTDEVYQGFDPLIERPVVVKVLRLADRPATDAIKQSFYREMQRTGVLTHPGIATLFDAGELPGALFMAREFVDGTSLTGLLERHADMELPLRVSLLLQMVDALEYAHDLGVPHLNLRPGNVFVSLDSILKIADFGVAKVLDTLALTQPLPAQAPATLAYLAPERVRGEPGDHRSDVFSLGRLALDVLGSPGHASLPPSLAARGVRAERWAALFDRVMAPQPAARFDSPGALKMELLLTLGVAESEARLAWDSSRTIGGLMAPEPAELTLPPLHAAGLFDEHATILVDGRSEPRTSSETVT